MQKLQKLFFLILMVSPLFSAAQIFSLKGTVVDSITGEKLPFVTILINYTGSIGTSSDSAGNFSVKSNEPITALRLSYVGYNSKTITFELKDKTSSINIQLSSLEQQLEDFTVVAGENPANRIIKLAVKNRDQNNYAKLNAYAYTAYQKFTFTGIPPKEGYSDSLKAKLFRYLGDNHFLIMEAVVDRKHLAPDLTKETVVAQKVSGLDNPNFTLLASQFQTTDFYAPYLNIATTDFVNPISPNSWDKYFFNVEDTLVNGNDTVYTVSYHPKKGKTFASLIGSLDINTDGYAIQHVTAEVTDTTYAMLFVKIEQRYAKVDSVHWFPTYLGTNIGFKNFLFPGLKVEMQGKSYIKDPLINLPLTKKDFDGVSIDLMEDMKKDDDYWIQNRADTLTVKEKTTYVLLDSLNKRYHFDRRLAWGSSFQDGLFRLPYVSIQIYNTIKFNKPEGVRLGLGLQTNSDFSKKYVLAAFAGYGMRDALWKYGGSIKWKIYEPKNIALTLKASMNYEENGGLDFFQGGYYGSGSGTRNYTIANFDFVDRKGIDFTARIRKYVNIQASGFTTYKRVTNDYEFLNNNDGEPVLMNEFHYTGVQGAVRFSYKERVVESLEHFYWINTGYPTFWFQFTQGFKGLLNGDFNYSKYEGRINYYFNTKSFGITSFTIEGGIVDGILPSTELYAGKSSYAPFGLYSPGSFQTMRSGEFMSDRFASLYFKQDFLKNVLQHRNFQPNFWFITNIGWGKLTHPETHVNAAFTSMEKGYFESGIVANNLIARKFGGVVRFGLGVGAFYRYGPYAFSNELQNFSFKGTLAYYIK